MVFQTRKGIYLTNLSSQFDVLMLHCALDQSSVPLVINSILI